MSKKVKRPIARLIANPGAGKVAEASKNLEMVTRTLQNYGLSVDISLARPKNEAVPLARKAVKDGYKIVIAMGGDGTIEAVMRGLMEERDRHGTKTHLGILPAGSANNIARSLGIPLDLNEACALIAQDHARKMDIGQLSTKKQKSFYFFELTAIGLTAALYPEAKEIPKGDLSSIMEVVRTLVQPEKKPKVILKMDDESKVEVETLLVTVSNTPLFGMNFLVAPAASLQDGLLDVSVYPNFNKAELLAYYAKVMNEGYSDDGSIQRYQVRKLKIKTSPRLNVMADGVMLGKGGVRIKIIPGALPVIAPEQEAGLAVPPVETGEDQPISIPMLVNQETEK